MTQSKGSFAGVVKRSNTADCKSAGLCLRGFESLPLHQSLVLIFSATKSNGCLRGKTSDWCLIPEILGKYQTTINSIAQELELSQEYLGCEVAEELFNV